MYYSFSSSIFITRCFFFSIFLFSFHRRHHAKRLREETLTSPSSLSTKTSVVDRLLVDVFSHHWYERFSSSSFSSSLWNLFLLIELSNHSFSTLFWNRMATETEWMTNRLISHLSNSVEHPPPLVPSKNKRKIERPPSAENDGESKRDTVGKVLGTSW